MDATQTDNDGAGPALARPSILREAHLLRTRQLWMLIWLVFLPFGAPTIVALFQSHPSPLRLVLSLSGAAFFLGLYTWNAWQGGGELSGATPPRERGGLVLWLPLVLMLVLAVALTVANGQAWNALFIFLTAAAGGRLPFATALGAVAALSLLIALTGWRAQLAFGDIAQSVVVAWVTAAATLTMAQSVRVNQALRAEREEMARLAATSAERLRIARDLHDLLGHSLSLIALKSELASRLARVAPERAAAEIRDIESVARTALQEVRQAVAGYRQPTLAEELRGAREMLAAAGISFTLEADDELESRLTPAVESVLGWAVREGMTNVIRHSGARSCRLRLRASADSAQLELLDDGQSAPSQGVATDLKTAGGSGLRGLRERVETQGGTLSAGPRQEGGFRLAVSLPLARSAPARGSPVQRPERAVTVDGVGSRGAGAPSNERDPTSDAAGEHDLPREKGWSR